VKSSRTSEEDLPMDKHQGLRRAAAAVLLLGIAGCSPTELGGGDLGTVEPAPVAPDVAPTDPEPEDGATGDSIVGTPSWTDPFEITLPTGWTLRDCEGKRPHLCVWDGEAFLGDIEIAGGYPLDPGEEDMTPEALLTARAEAFLEHFGRDRAEGCPGFSFTGDPVAGASMAGIPAVRTGFTLRAEDGLVVERVVNHYALHEGEVWLVNTDAYATDGGCLGPSETDPSFPPDAMTAIERFLDDVVLRTPMPTAPPS
jgi:hypothetical protein